MVRHFHLVMLLLIACGGNKGNSVRNTTPNTVAARSEPTTTRMHTDTTLFVAFYNLENLFDTENDPRTEDDDFTPSGRSRWTPERLHRKLENIARAIRAMNDGRGPDIIGVCEVENARLLDMLAEEHLPPHEYRVVHADSRDRRGIDVALLYRESSMLLRRTTMHPVVLGTDVPPTRDVMEVSFERQGCAFTVLVNHWPSRRGGAARSSFRREMAASVVASVVDSLLAIDALSDVVVMGDLNDTPFDVSVRRVLDAEEYSSGGRFVHRLISASMPVAREGRIGSYYYRGDWELIDHLLLSRGLLDDRGLVLFDDVQTIFAPTFLRDRGAHPIDGPPYRTYNGPMQYLGGASDHFPVTLRVGFRGDCSRVQRGEG